MRKKLSNSIAAQLAVMFIGLLVFVMAAMLFVNNTFMEEFYEVRLRTNLTKAYQQIDDHIGPERGPDHDFFANTFSNLERTENISLVLLDQDFEPVYEYPEWEEQVMMARLTAYSFGLDRESAHLIEETDSYVVQKKNDTQFHLDYLEMWGVLPKSGYHFMMRIPMDSIRGYARISNEFILYTILIGVIISILVIGWMSKRVAKPIRELSRLSERMCNLDFDAKYTSGGKNEIGQLGEHFNRMSETLEKTISELKTANNELQKNLEEKEKIDDMRREFLSNVSHELKTPLALIQGYAEGLRDSVADDAESRDYYCEVIVDEADKMNTLVKKLLSLNQLEFGGDKVEMARFDLGDLITGTVASTKLLADQKGAVLTYEGPEHVEVWGDEFKVEEVLTNYLSNAIHYVTDRIVVRTYRTEDGKIRTSVFNTGIHIPEEDLDHVWDKFFKVDKARTRSYGGSGVGLSIVKAIMESMHQGFGVENVEGGVSFWFELECAESDEAGREKEKAAFEKRMKIARKNERRNEIVDGEWTSTE